MWHFQSANKCIVTLPRGRHTTQGTDDELNPETMNKRRVRVKGLAQRYLFKFIVEFVRIGIVLKTSLGRCSDVRRMWRLLAALQKEGASREEMLFSVEKFSGDI